MRGAAPTAGTARPPVPVTGPAWDSAAADVRTFFEKTGGVNPDLSRIPRVKPPLRALQVDPEGRLWVAVTTSDAGVTYDVYRPDGLPLASVRTMAGISPYHGLRFLAGRVYAVAADDTPRVIQLRLTGARLAGTARER
jgi:hypothetical protein